MSDDEVADLGKKLESLAETVDEIHDALVGTIDDDRPGILSRLKTVESANTWRTKIELTGAFALFALLGQAVYDLVMR
jgi:hypothetical protein